MIVEKGDAALFTVNRNPSVGVLRSFGWAMLGGFGFIGLVLWVVPRLSAGDVAIWGWSGNGSQVVAVCLWALGAGLCILSLSSPSLAKPVYVVWMSVAALVGMIMATLLLSVLFVVFLPVFSVVVRFGDPLGKKLRKDGTYWEDPKPFEPTLERMERLF